MDVDTLVQAVLELGDDELEVVFEAARVRDRQLRANKIAENFAQLTPGTRVAICGTIRPKYLLGVTGRVVPVPTKRDGDIMIEVDSYWRGHAARYINSATGRVAVPANCLRSL